MIFTIDQYDQAIKALQEARQQHIDGTTGQGCSVCGGNCHPDQCGFNPLYAMEICSRIANQSEALHESLHQLSGFQTYMGETVGPAKVVLPEP